MDIRKYARIYGVVLFFWGILSFIPGLTVDDHFLGIFFVNATLNIIHIVIGGIGFIVGGRGTKACRFFFQIIGVLFAIIAFWGFAEGFGFIMGGMANDMADSWFHLVFALIALYLGFLFKRQK